MSERAADVLELLLPRAEPALQARARKLTTFLRLVSNDASPRRATSVRLGLEGARAELARATRERLLGAVRSLLLHYLAAARGAECFLDLEEPALSHQEAWSEFDEERAEASWLAELPPPGELALETATRLLACGERMGLSELEAGLWRARVARLAEGVRAGEEAFLALLATSGDVAGPGEHREALGGAAECLLDRGAVQRAAALLDEHRAVIGDDPRLLRLQRWIRLLLGREPGAVAPAQPTPPRLPAPLVDLRELRPDWLPVLAGRAARERAGARGPGAQRADLGAALLAVFAHDGAGAVRVVHLECAPALRSRVGDWLARRDGACRRAGELEHELVLRAAPVVAHASGDEAPCGVIAGESIRAVALAPVLDAGEEIAGWLRLECEHHLLPSRTRLRELALSWRERVLLPDVQARVGERASALFQELAERDPRGKVLSELIERLGIKLAARRWWGFAVREGVPLLASSGGGALEGWRERPGGAGALRRATTCAGVVRFDGGDASVAIAAEAASGIVLPLLHRGLLVGVIALESVRRRDFEGTAAPLEQAARAGAQALRIACFRAWHAERFGHDVHFDAQAPASAALLADLLAATVSSGPVCLSGAAGSGKQVLARWLHFESNRSAASLVVHACGAREPFAEERELLGDPARRDAGGRFERARAGTLVLDDLERLASPSQARLETLLASLAPGDLAPRLVATSRRPLREAVEAGRLREDLGSRLQRVELYVPALAQRREEIPGLVSRLAARFAAELGLDAPAFSDEAMALLWRQPWCGNLRELENVVYKLVLLDGRRPVEVAHVEDVARRFRLELVRRLPSRHPEPGLIEAALRTTRTARGSLNKTRAALYLGWDPDTLMRRRSEQEASDHDAFEASRESVAEPSSPLQAAEFVLERALPPEAPPGDKEGRPVVPPDAPPPYHPGGGERTSPNGPPGHATR